MKRKLTAMILAAGAMLGAWAANVRLYVSAPSAVAWGDSWYCYAWDDGVQLLGGWPGTKTVKTETRDGVTWHYWDVTVNSDFCLILNDGSGKQTGDFAVTGVSDGKAYFIEVAKSGGNHSCQIVNVGVVADTHNKVQLWENGPYWATTNIGADEPWDSGYYFWWGDTIGYKRENNKWVASDGSSADFSFESGNAPTYNKDAATLQSEGWITSDGVLAPEHDAAQAHWGEGWRMPTYQELYDLCYNKCDWTWTTLNGVNGYVVCGKGEYASASIFLPVSGRGNRTSLEDDGSKGYYRSSVPGSSSYDSWTLYFFLGDRNTVASYRYCFHGYSVRPVHETLVTVTFNENFEGGNTTNISFLSTSKVLANVPAVPARVGWELVGWFDAAEGGNQISADALPTDGATYYAHWQKVSYVAIGSGTAVNTDLPTRSYYKYSLTEQIYTRAEIGGACLMDGISFRSNMETSRSLDVYLVHTDKSAFSGSTDWIGVTAADKVFSGDVAFAADDWTKITFDTPFIYNGTDNLAVVVDDNTGTYVSGQAFYVFDAPETAIRVYSDGTNYDPANASGYDGTVVNVKNQIRLEAAELVEVSVTFNENFEGGSTTNVSTYSAIKVLARAPAVPARAGWTFIGWYTADGTRVSETDLPTDGATYYAHWFEGEFTMNGLWFVDEDGNWHSGRMAAGGWMWMSTVVDGPGTLSFEWMISSPDDARYFELMVDGNREKFLSAYRETTDWLPIQYEIGEGQHEIDLVFSLHDCQVENDNHYGAMRNWKWTPAFAEVVPDVSLNAGKYFKATLAELGYDVPTDGQTAYSVKAYGLPAGLKLVGNKAVTKKDKKGKKVVVTPANVEWWIEGVPTAALDYATNPPYLVITTNGVAQTLPLSLGVEAQEVTELPDLALGETINAQFYLEGVTNSGWTVSGLPTGLKYTAKLLTTTKKKGKKVISVTTNALPYSVYGKTTKAGLFTITAKKKVGSFYETMKYRVLVTPAGVDTSRFTEDLTNMTTMAYVPFEWHLTNDVSSVSGKVAKVTGLPPGLTFAASDVYGYANAKKKTGKYVKQYGQTIIGKPTKPGKYVVTFTKNVTTGTGKKKKTVAKTAQIFWTVTENDAELSLGFNEKGAVIESGMVGLSYGDLMAFDATDGAKVTASGLPAGIKLADLGGGKYAFTGFTAKAGTYLVTVTATLNGKTVRQRVALKVDGLPSWAKGTYNGASMFAGSGMKYSGLATVTVSAAGKISGKYQANGTNWTFSASSYDLYDDEKGLYYCTNIVAKYAYKVTEKVKGKKKIVTRYLERNILFLTRNWEVSPGVSFGVAMAGEGDDAIYAYQNVWGRSDYKTLGKKLFYTSKKKPYNIWNDVDAKDLTDAMSLSVKVTSAGAVTATMTFDTGKTTTNKKTKKKTKVYYTATCTTVLIPVSAAGADPFDAMALLYFAPSAANNFPGFCAELHHPFSKRIAPQPGFANSWFTGEFTGYGDAQFPIPDTENYDILNGLFSINVAANLSFTGKFTATDGTTASFSGTFAKSGDSMYAASGVSITLRGQTMTMRLGCAAQPYAGKDAGFGEMWGGSDSESGEPCIFLNCAWQNIWKRSDIEAEWKPAFASGAEKTLDMSEIFLDGKVAGDTLTYAFGADGAVAVSGQIYGESVNATATLDLEGYDESTNTMYCNFYFLANGHMYQQQLTFPRQGTVAATDIALNSFVRID